MFGRIKKCYKYNYNIKDNMKNITYKEFIENILNTRGRFACGDEYYEKHHIVPKCLGGTNSRDNLIDLYAREHFVAHRLLALENPENNGLAHAWTLMSRINNHDGKYEVTPEEYEEARKKYITLMKGKSFSEEHRMKIGKANKGRIVPEDARSAVAKANANRIWSKESRQKLSNSMSGENHPLYGKHHTEEAKRKMSESQKGLFTGEKNPRALIILQFDKEDNLIKVWRYIKLASKELKIDASDISSCAKGKLKSAGGYRWKFLYDNKYKDKPVAGAITLGLITEEEALKQLNPTNEIKK